MSAERIDAPEMAMLLHDAGALPMTAAEAKALERDLARHARAYARAMERVRKARAALRKAQGEAREMRRAMRLLISVRKGDA